MTSLPLDSLDQTDLLQLALQATTANDNGTALYYLKEAILRPDATAPVRFLLASLYAQLNLFDKAIPEMEAALALDPTMGVARFQLGLMQLTAGNTARAMEVLLPLADYGPAHYLAHFGAGLRLLIQDELEAAVQCLAKGISLNKDVVAMNDDMRKIIDRLGNYQIPGPNEDLADAPSALFLAAYMQNRGPKNTH
jgi:tetratricopeptide (TPR) repeat protein